MKKIILSTLLVFFLFEFSQAQDWANLMKFQNENAVLTVPDANEARIVFMGNSIFEFWLRDRPDFFSDKHYVNRGISGQTTPQMLLRFRQDVINIDASVVVILAGINDIAGNTGPSTIEMIADNIYSMAELAKSNNIDVVLCSVLPAIDFLWKPGMEPAEKVIILNTLIKSYAEKNDIVYVDYFTPMVDEFNGLRKDLGGDGVHPNAAGYSIMEPLIEEAISKVLSENISGRRIQWFKKRVVESIIKFDDTRETKWSEDFELVEINSSKDNVIQKAYFYKSTSDEPKPLIVSLHTWSGGYSQIDDLATICKQKDLNYIHPDFRGANKTIDDCCSELALSDIDDAISHAIKNSNVDTTKIYVIGVSGGGYATLSTFMKSKHAIKKFSAWASITDLIAWYNESKIRNNKYAQNILDCTNSRNGLNLENARHKSPIYWVTPTEKLKDSQLKIYVGVFDGIQGSVPITHSINFYNKLLSDLSVKDSSKYVSVSEKLELIEKRQALSNFGTIANRKVCLKKEYENLQLVVFEGNHEMLTEFALNELLEE